MKFYISKITWFNNSLSTVLALFYDIKYDSYRLYMYRMSKGNGSWHSDYEQKNSSSPNNVPITVKAVFGE